jgi:hypothetical protein
MQAVEGSFEISIALSIHHSASNVILLHKIISYFRFDSWNSISQAWPHLLRQAIPSSR